MKRFALFCLIILNACVIQRSVVRQPKLSLHVTDGSVPVANANIYLYWISYPYGRLEQAQTFTTNAEGNLRLEQVLQNDTAYPLALHGVAEYEHKLCIEAQGYRTLLVTLVALPGDDIRLDAPLVLGESLEVCSNYDTLSSHLGVARPDITAQHESIRGAYEVTE